VPRLPAVSFGNLYLYYSPAFSLAMLIAIESLLGAVIADGMTGRKHNPNMELVAHGVANICCPVFGGIPATAVLARTVTNIRSGGQTPVAGIVNAVLLLLFMLFFAPLVSFIPMPAIAAVLVYVAWTMGSIPAIRTILKGQTSDSIVLVVTFCVTVFVSMPLAIESGLILSAFFFIKKMIDVSAINLVHNEMASSEADTAPADPNSLSLRNIPKEVLVYEIEGSLFFGSVRKFEQALSMTGVPYRVLILRMRDTIYIDAGGIHALAELYEDCRKRNVVLLLSDIHTQPFLLVAKSGLDRTIGEGNIFGNLDEALERAASLL